MTRNRDMYRWRRLTPDERSEVLRERQKQRRAWHGPPHYSSPGELYLITASCYEHKPIIGASLARLAEYEQTILEVIKEQVKTIFAWTILPNHYHVLAHAPDVFGLLKAIGLTHGRTSYRWNLEEGCQGRKVWHRAAETAIKSEGHFWASLNYVLHNAVRHGYVEHWQDWPFCNALEYLNEVGRETAEKRWLEYPILDYGKDWDPPEL